MPYVYLVILLMLVVYSIFGVQVSLARAKYKIDAPATIGNPVFERRFRVHQNTAEQLVIFIPALLLFATFLDANWAAGLGAVFIVSRLIYMQSYVDDPKGRVLGFGLGGFVNGVLVLGALWGVARSLLQ